MLNLPRDLLRKVEEKNELAIGLQAVSKLFPVSERTKAISVREILKESYNVVREANWDNIKDKVNIVKDIAILITSFDTDLAEKLAKILPKTERDRLLVDLARVVVQFNILRAKNIAESIETPHFRDEALILVAKEYAIVEGLEPALEIIAPIAKKSVKVKAIQELAATLSLFDADKAKILIDENLDQVEDRIHGYGEMIKGVQSIETASRLLKIIEDLSLSLDDPKTRVEMIVYSASLFINADPDKARKLALLGLSFVEEFKGNGRGVMLLSLLKIFLLVDPKKAETMLFLTHDPDIKDLMRLELIEQNLKIDLAKAEKIAYEIENEDHKDYALNVVGTAYTKTDLKKSQDISKLIKDRLTQNELKCAIVKELVNEDVSKAFSIANSLEGKYCARAYAEILKVQEQDKVMVFLKTLGKDHFKALLLIELAKNEFYDKAISNQMLQEAFEILKSQVGHHEEKAKMLIAVAKAMNSN